MQIQKQELTISHTMYRNINHKRTHTQVCDARSDIELRVSVQVDISDRKEVGRQRKLLYTSTSS
jgi:hypothetical protein